MRATSSGSEVIFWPCGANRRRTVNSRPYSATGAILGRNRVSYQSRPRARSPSVRVRYPATSGMPRKTATAPALSAAGPLAERAGQIPGHQRDAEEDRDRAGDLGDGHVQAGGLQAEPAGQDLEIEEAEHGVEQDLEDRVQRDQHGRHLAVSAC